MSKLFNTSKLNRFKIKYQEFDKVLTVLLIIGIVFISAFIIAVVFTPEPGYITMGILNSDKKAEDYPSDAMVGENVTFYITVGNYLNRDFSFRVEILKGNNETEIGSSGSSNATSFMNTSTILISNRENWISNAFNVSFSQPGFNQIVIAELWEIRIGLIDKFWEVVTMRVNITS